MLTSTRPDSRLTAGLATVFYRYVCDVNAVSCVCLEICCWEIIANNYVDGTRILAQYKLTL